MDFRQNDHLTRSRAPADRLSPSVPSSAYAGSAQSSAPDHVIHESFRHRIWDRVSHSPLHSLWDLQGVSLKVVLKRTWNSFNDDNLLSRAAELGYYFLFALFPTLISASSIFGLIARSSDVYYRLLNYLSLVIPHAALGIVLETFHQTTSAASTGKVTFGLAAALWSASVGFTAIQDTLNIVYRVKETRPYWKVRGAAILVTALLSLVTTLMLASLFSTDFLAHHVADHISQHQIGLAAMVLVRLCGWTIATGLLMLIFSIIYYFAPDVRNKQWHWLTPGATFGILGWLLASICLRVYLYYFNSYSVTYGSLGAVIILLTWFYITGLMLLAGAELNSEIAAAVIEKNMKESGELPNQATADLTAPVQAA